MMTAAEQALDHFKVEANPGDFVSDCGCLPALEDINNGDIAWGFTYLKKTETTGMLLMYTVDFIHLSSESGRLVTVVHAAIQRLNDILNAHQTFCTVFSDFNPENTVSISEADGYPVLVVESKNPKLVGMYDTFHDIAVIWTVIS